MSENTSQLYPWDTSALKVEVMPQGKLIEMPYAFYKQYNYGQLAYFMWENGLYILPTEELMDWLFEKIIGNAIEICAGNGALGRALNIPITDNKMQTWKEVALQYALTNQPVMNYPDDVEELDALEAIKKYKPDTIIGSFVTHKYKVEEHFRGGNMYGPDEQIMLKRVRRYIMIGNLITHKYKPLLSKKHEEYYFPWLITRGVQQDKNRIFVWNNF